MKDDTTVPDSAITLEPSGNPGDIRPSGPGWITTTPDNRVATIVIGENLKTGGTVTLAKKENVKQFIVELTKPTEVSFKNVLIIIF